MSKAAGRAIVLTGVSRGLGLAMAEGFIAAGHTVCGCARSEKSLDSLRSQFASPHRFDAVDVAEDSAVERWAKSVLSSHGPPDLLINNAAAINRNAPLWKISAAEFEQVVSINICGVANVIRHFAPAMVARAAGVIVNFSSGWGRSTSPEVAPYCASKFAIEGLTQALAQELPRGMAAVPLNPGVINTEMLQSCFGGAAGGYPTPAQWAKLAVPYILRLSAKNNGESLSVPGA